MQLTGQTGSQAPQSMQSDALMKRLLSTSEMQLTGQTGSQAPQLTHSSLLMIRGIVSSCRLDNKKKTKPLSDQVKFREQAFAPAIIHGFGSEIYVHFG